MAGGKRALTRAGLQRSLWNRSRTSAGVSRRHVGRLLACCCLLAACTPAPSPASATNTAESVRISRFRISTAGAELAARVASPGDVEATVLALHGGPGLGSSYMHDLERLAHHGYAVVTYDQRGVADSTIREMDFSLAANLSDLEAVRAATTSDPVVLFGHSWGGLLALNYTAEHPDRVRGLILFGSAPPTRSALLQAARRFERRLSRLQAQGIVPSPLPTGEEYLRAIQPAYLANPGADLPPELDRLSHSPQVNRSTWAALGDFDYRSKLGAIDVPVLFFYGEDDPFGPDMARATLAALERTQVEVVWLQDCGHYWFECPGPFMDATLAFLARNATGADRAGAVSELD